MQVPREHTAGEALLAAGQDLGLPEGLASQGPWLENMGFIPDEIKPVHHSEISQRRKKLNIV